MTGVSIDSTIINLLFSTPRAKSLDNLFAKITFHIYTYVNQICTCVGFMNTTINVTKQFVVFTN